MTRYFPIFPAILVLVFLGIPICAQDVPPTGTPKPMLPQSDETRQSATDAAPPLAKLILTGPSHGFTERTVTLRIVLPTNADEKPLSDVSILLQLPEGLTMVPNAQASHVAPSAQNDAHSENSSQDNVISDWYRDLTPAELRSGNPVELSLRVERSGPMVLRIALESETIPVAQAVWTITGVQPLNPLPPAPVDSDISNAPGASEEISVWVPDRLAQRLRKTVPTSESDLFTGIPPIDPNVVAQTLGPDGPGAVPDAPTTATPDSGSVSKTPWTNPANQKKERDLGEPILESSTTDSKNTTTPADPASTDSANTDSSQTPSEVKLIRLKPDEPVWIERKNEQPVSVYVLGEICNRECPLELFAGLGRHGKDHESIVRCPVLASTVHAALLVCGAEPGGPARWEPEYTPPSGTQIEVLLRWKNELGMVQQCRAQDWIRSTKTKMAMEYSFVFAGSQFVTNPHTGRVSYGADRDEEFICVSNFPYATFDIPVESTDDNAHLAFEAWTERIPPLETPVTLQLKLVR